MQDELERLVEHYKERILDGASDGKSLGRHINQVKAEITQEYDRRVRGLKDARQYSDVGIRNTTLGVVELKRKALELAVSQIFEDEGTSIKLKLGEGLPYTVSKATGIDPRYTKVLNPRAVAIRIIQALFIGFFAMMLFPLLLYGGVALISPAPVTGANGKSLGETIFELVIRIDQYPKEYYFGGVVFFFLGLFWKEIIRRRR